MEKLCYLLRCAADRPGPDLRAALLEKTAPALREGGALQLGLSIDDEHVAAGGGVAIRRSEPPIRALASFWMQNADDRGSCEDALRREAEALDGYLVVESRPLVHAPPRGERAPGANLVTCIRRKAGLDDATFFDRWNREHRQVAIETQSTTGYVRNAIVRPLTEGAPCWDGIVEETFPIEALTNPKVWYACENHPDSDAEYRRRLRRMIDSVSAFLDLDVLESTPMSEYWLG